MHYKNGREAKNGDKVMFIPTWGAPVVGILYDATAGNDTCNGKLAPCQPNDPCPNLAECLHVDDVKAADQAKLIADSTKLAGDPATDAPSGLKAATALLIACLLLAFGFSARAGTPVDYNVPLIPNLPYTIITNATWISNTATAFQPPQGTPTRLLMNVTGPAAGYASTNIVGLDLTFDPGTSYLNGGTGTNWTTGQPVSVTFVNDTSFGLTCTMSAYLPATNFDCATGARLGKLQVIGTNTVNWIRLETTR